MIAAENDPIPALHSDTGASGTGSSNPAPSSGESANLGPPQRQMWPDQIVKVFAIGDVRTGSIKRVAASVGEGAQVVAALHAFLAEAGDTAALPANTGRH